MKKNLTVFNTHYRKLNPSQKKAVDTIDGPVMVIAGPGTGKTQILTLRIANILRRTDASPDSILALTFTESAAFSMRRRLVEVIGSDAYRVNFFTFHGFANEIIKKYPEEFEEIIGSRNITDADQIMILREIIDNNEFKLLKPYGEPHYYIRSSLDAIRDLKREDISPSDFIKLIEAQKKEFEKTTDLYHTKGKYKGEMKGKWLSVKKSIEKNFELALMYSKYQTRLRERKFYDFEDMIMEVVRVLSRKKDLLLEIQETYQYILADEHQDTNNAQNRLLELVSSYYDSPNLFVVGDEKQAIFRFQGASLENFLYFKKRFPKAEIIFLKTNYRSGQRIIDVSQNVIKKDDDKEAAKYRVDLVAGRPFNSKVFLYRFNTEDEQNHFIAQDIKKLLDSGVSPQEIAILYRDNKEAFAVSKALAEMALAHRIESNLNLLTHDIIWRLVTVLRSIDDLSNDRYLAELLYLDLFDIPSFDVHKLIEISGREKTSLFKIMTNSRYLVGLIASERILILAERLESLARIGRNKHLIDSLTEIVNETGILRSALTSGHEALSAVEQFFEAAKQISESRFDYRLPDFVRHLELLEKYNIQIKAKEDASPIPAVRLMTAHKSKGLEFEYVFIISLNDGRWGNRRELNKFKLPLYKSVQIDSNRDERKLFYVALTRAKKRCTLTSYALTTDSKNVLPSIFIDEMDSNLLDEQKVYTNVGLKANVVKNVPLRRTVSIDEKDYIKALFDERGLSVSALNNYLECPSKYFFESLIRIPKSLSKPQQYGNAIHETLADAQNRIDRGGKMTKQAVLKILKDKLEAKLLSKEDFKELYKKGRDSLSVFFEKKVKHWKPQMAVTEMGINGVFFENEEVKVYIKGRLDRVDFVGQDQLIVTDFKTSKPKTRNQILGKTKTSDANIYRQLVFYSLLLDGHANGKYRMVGGLIVFTEPDERGNLREEFFEVAESDKQDLKREILKVASEINSLEFLNMRCDKAKCEYCQMMNNLNYSSTNDSTKDLSSK